jgi:hypothetical protein
MRGGCINTHDQEYAPKPTNKDNNMHDISSDPTVTFDWSLSVSGDDHFLTIEADENHAVDNPGEVCLDRKEAHELHAFLQVALGLVHPTPTSPLTASLARKVDRLPASGPVVPSRRWDVV